MSTAPDEGVVLSRWCLILSGEVSRRMGVGTLPAGGRADDGEESVEPLPSP